VGVVQALANTRELGFVQSTGASEPAAAVGSLSEESCRSPKASPRLFGIKKEIDRDDRRESI